MGYLLVSAIIGWLILIHELGHFWAARRVGIPIERFSVGFGSFIYSWKKGETEYGLAWFPLGGYVLPGVKDEDEYFRIPVGKRLWFAVAGPLINVAFAVPCFALVNVLVGGFSLNAALVEPFVQTLGGLKHILFALAHLFERPDQTSSIVGIVVQGKNFIAGDLAKTAQFAGMLSLNLAIFNLLPVPALDGGRILMGLAEKIHPKARVIQGPLAIGSWIFLIGLMLYATRMDVQRYF